MSRKAIIVIILVLALAGAGRVAEDAGAEIGGAQGAAEAGELARDLRPQLFDAPAHGVRAERSVRARAA